MQKVFISWCGADRDLKNSLYAKMRQSFGDDVDIWESDERCVSNFSEECIRSIRESDVFVLLLSNAAQTQSTYVINEVIEARGLECRGKLNIVVYNVDSCALTETFAMQINHISDANHVKNMRGENDDNFGVLIDRVKLLLKRRADGNPVKPLTVAEPKIVGLPVINNNYYVQNSRDEVLDKLAHALRENNVVFVNEISGYGRKSAAKIFACEHSDEYDEALELHDYCNSVTEFLTRAVKFENISDEIYDKLGEKDVILKKISLLKQLTEECGKKVLLMVPYVKFDKCDFNDFIYTSLKSLPVKVMFVTENVPKEFADRFATVYVGKMDNKYLEELFFHYVELDEYEKKEILPVVDAFFDSVGGHTAAVELTAKTIAEEFGLTSADIAEALNKVRPDTDNDLSQRIYSAYANLFSLKQFDDKQLKTLALLGLACDAPVSERFVAQLLKSCNLYDASAIKALCDAGWAKRDTSAKTVSVEPVVAKLCLAQAVLDKQILADVLNFLCQKFINLDLLDETVTSLRFAAKIYAYLEAYSYSELCERCVKYMFSATIDRQTLSDAEELIQNAKIEDAQLGDSFEMCGAYIVGVIEALLQAVKNSDEEETITRADIANGVLEDGNGSVNGEAWDLIESLSFVFPLGEALAETVAGKKNITPDEFADLLKEMAAKKEEMLTVDETYGQTVLEEFQNHGFGFDAMMKYVGNTLGILVNNYAKSAADALTKLNVREAWAVFADAYSDVLGKSLVYSAHSVLLADLYDLNCDSIRTEREADICAEMLNRYKKSLFASFEAYEQDALFVCTVKAGIALRQSRLDEAARRLEYAINNYGVTKQTAAIVVECAENIIEACSRANEREFAEKLIKQVFTPRLVKLLIEAGEEGSPHLARVNAYLDIVAAERGELREGSRYAEDKNADYYEQFGLQSCDRRTYECYKRICNEVSKYDYSSFTQNQLLEEVEKLRKRASNGWKQIAPEAFALASEAGKRILGFAHHWVQYYAACCMLDGNVAQILNGEGKTYAIVLAVFAHYLTGLRVNVLDCSDHLARRNYNWMGNVLRYLGVTVGFLAQPVSREQINRVVDCDVIYAGLSDFLQILNTNEFYFAKRSIVGDAVIADEADEVMIELGGLSYQTVVNGKYSNQTAMAEAVCEVMEEIANETEAYFKVNSYGNVEIKQTLYERVKAVHDLMNDGNAQWNANLSDALLNAVRAYYLHERNKHYFVRDGKVQWEDKNGALLGDNSGLYSYFVARKERLFSDKADYDKMLTDKTVLNYNRFVSLCKQYKHVCGTTATAMSMKEEFAEFYGKKVVCVPPNKPCVRIDHVARVFVHDSERDDAIIQAVSEMHGAGRPVLVIADNMYSAERLSKLLGEKDIQHTLLNARNAYDEERILANCGRTGAVTVATAIANRGVDIALGGSASFLARQKLLDQGFTLQQIQTALSGDDSALSKSIAVYYSQALAETFADVRADCERVQGLGGLAVICASCFEDLRLEQQARGRCGRQGQPGDSYVYLSFEDKVLKQLCGPLLSMFRGVTEEITTGLLNSVLQKGRQTRQTDLYGSLYNNSPSACTDPYREKIVGLCYDLINGKINCGQVCDRYVCRNADFIKRWQRGNLRENERLAINGIADSAPQKRKDAEAVLQAAFNGKISELGSDLCGQALAVCVFEQWQKFFGGVWAKYDLFYEECGRKASVARKRASEYAHELCENCLIDAVLKFFGAKVEIRR